MKTEKGLQFLGLGIVGRGRDDELKITLGPNRNVVSEPQSTRIIESIQSTLASWSWKKKPGFHQNVFLYFLSFELKIVLLL